jgi:NAD-dependent dihydropyrimidine dehydrogenase PreA subunit
MFPHNWTGRPPRNPIGILRAFIVMRMKAVRSLREMSRILDTDPRLRRLCLIKPGEAAYPRSVLSRFIHRVGEDNLTTIIEEKVINQDLCAACGACLSLCPYLRSWKGRVVKLDNCNLEEGRCYAYCPRTEVDLDSVYQKIFGKGCEEIEMGPFRRIMMARARDPQFTKRAQTGGAVSALFDFALKEGMVQSGVLTPRDGELLPQGEDHKKSEEDPQLCRLELRIRSYPGSIE